MTTRYSGDGLRNAVQNATHEDIGPVEDGFTQYGDRDDPPGEGDNVVHMGFAPMVEPKAEASEAPAPKVKTKTK